MSGYYEKFKLILFYYDFSWVWIHGESIGQHLDLETIKKEQLEFAKEATKEIHSQS